MSAMSALDDITGDFERSLLIQNASRGVLKPHAESLLILAERAFYSGRKNIARSVVEHFLRRSPQKDQHYCRANTLMGLILDHEARDSNGTESIRKRKYALTQMIIAIDVATSAENVSRYDFIVYNTSLSCWSVMRPFMRAGRAKSFMSEVCRISGALEKCDDSDMEWRIMYLSAAALCCFDSQQIKPAEEAIDKAIQHADKLLSTTTATMQNILSEIESASSELEEASSSLRKLEEKEELLRKKKKKIDCDAEEEVVQEVIVVSPVSDSERRAELAEKEIMQSRIAAALARKTSSADKLRAINDVNGEQQTSLTRLYMQRVHTNPVDSKKVVASPTVVSSLRVRCLVQLQCVTSGCVEAKDLPGVFAGLIRDLNAAVANSANNSATGGSSGSSNNNSSSNNVNSSNSSSADGSQTSEAQVAESLMDLCRIAWQKNSPEYAIQSLELATKINCPSSPVLRVKMDLCKALQVVAECGSSANSSYTQRLSGREVEGHSVGRRIEAMKMLERILPICQSRIGDFVLVQEICIAVWNTVLPLLQPHLRKYAHRALQMIARALEERDSSLTLLRARIHFELCKCEDLADFVGKAKEEADKALNMDYGLLSDDTLQPQSTAKKDKDGGGGKDSKDGKGKGAGGGGGEGDLPVKKDAELDRMRAMDHLIKPLQSSLHLRLSVYEAPKDVEGQVILLLQQGRESGSTSVHTDILLKAAGAMEAVLTRRPNRDDDEHDSPPRPLTSVSLEAVDELLNAPRIIEPGGSPETSAPKYSAFTVLDQKRTNIFVDIARMAQKATQRDLQGPRGVPGQSSIVTLKAVQYVLSKTWNHTDVFCRELIDAQIECHFHLVGGLVDRLAALSMEEEMEEEYARECDEANLPHTELKNTETNESKTEIKDDKNTEIKENQISTGDSGIKGPVPDPRALGLISKYATEEMKTIKRLILLTLSRALQLSVMIGDEVGIQNATVHFWNLHLHIFRRKLSRIAMTEVFEFLKQSNEALQQQLSLARTANSTDKSKGPPKGDKGGKTSPRGGPTPNVGILTPQLVDERLALSVVEALVEFFEVRGEQQEALNCALKAISIDSPPPPAPSSSTTSSSSALKNDSIIITAPFIRRRLCEAICRCAARLAIKPPAPIPPAVALAVNNLKFDSVFLTVYSLLTLAEMPSEMTNNDTVLSSVEKASRLMDTEVTALLLTLDWPTLSQDDYDQIIEMQAEIYARIVRLHIVLGDIYSAQLLAEKCLSLLTANIDRDNNNNNSNTSSKESDTIAIRPPTPPGPQTPGTGSGGQKFSPRVWRWISVCEKYFGIAICRVIKDEGQDEALKSELRLAGLRHFALACTYGVRAQRVELIIDAATTAWNVIKVAIMGEGGGGGGGGGGERSILNLQTQMLENLLGCKEEVGTIPGALPALSVLLQQMYVSMVTQLCDYREWTKASKLVMEAFQHVPPALQKPLWRLRVIVMSKQGKNVLDGIQKMIAGDDKKDLGLQARVYGILARASSTGRQQLEAYRKTIELLSGDAGRVDYILETAQWMSSYGLSRPALSDMLLSALDALYEIEESNLIPLEGEEGDGEGGEGSVSTPGTHRSKTSRAGYSAAPSARSARSMTSSRGGGGGGAGGSRKMLGSSNSRKGKGSQTSRRGPMSVMDEDGPSVPSGLDAKQCEQAVRTSLMLAMLQSDETARLERLLESVYFIGRGMELWSVALMASDKQTQWQALSIKEKEETSYLAFTPTSPGQNPALTKIPTDAMSLLSWQPSALFLELNTICTVQQPLQVPSTVSYPLMPLTVHYLLWAAREFHVLGHQKHGLLLLGWLRAVLFVIPLQRKEFVLAAAHYTSLDILYSCEIKRADIDRILPQMLGGTGLAPSIFLSRIGEETMSELSGLSSAPGASPGGQNVARDLSLDGSGSGGAGGQQNVSRVSTITKVMLTADSTATDTPACLLIICRSLRNLGQIPQCQSLVGAARVHSVLRGDKYSELSAIAMSAEMELGEGRSREALALLLINKGGGGSGGSGGKGIGAMCDGALAAAVASTVATCYTRLGARDESRRVIEEALQLLDSGASVGGNPSSTSLLAQRDNASATNMSNLNSQSSNMSHASSIGSITPVRNTVSTVGTYEGNIECAVALVDVFCTYLTLLSEEVCSCAVNGTVDFDFKGTLAVMRGMVEIVTERTTGVAGRVSVLTARALERYAYAAYSCLCEMQTVSNSYGGMTVSEYTQWFEETLASVIQSTAAAVDIRRDLCSRLSDKELTFEIPANVNSSRLNADSGSGNSPKKAKAPPVKALGRKASKLNVDATEVKGAIGGSEAGEGGEEAGSGSLLSSLQRDLSKAECLLATQKYHLGVIRGHNASAVGGLSALQQKRRIAELSAPERYLELSKPPPETKGGDFEVKPIGEGMLLSSSALQIVSAIASSSSSSSAASSVPTAAGSPTSPPSSGPIDSSVLYNTGYVLQLSGTGAFDSMWTPYKDEDDPAFPPNTPNPAPTASTAPTALLNPLNPTPNPVNPSNPTPNGVLSLQSQSLVMSSTQTVCSASDRGDTEATVHSAHTQNKIEEFEDFVPTDDAAARARSDLAIQATAAIAGRRFEVSAIAAGALVSAYGIRQVRSAVCWLLQLQSINARALLLKQWDAALNPTCEAKRSLRRLRALEGNNNEGKGRDAELTFLANSSVCWNRLDISADPAAVLAATPPNTVIMCLQMCPYKKVLYACVGVRAPTTATAPVAGKKPSITDNQAAERAALEASGGVGGAGWVEGKGYKAQGEWSISKVPLSEGSRRMLMTLTSQHAVWCEDTNKFIARYGDCITKNEDIEGQESTHTDTKIKKTEAALEERLRHLIDDMGAIVDGVLGPKSDCHRFLTMKYKDCFPPPPTAEEIASYQNSPSASFRMSGRKRSDSDQSTRKRSDSDMTGRKRSDSDMSDPNRSGKSSPVSPSAKGGRPISARMGAPLKRGESSKRSEKSGRMKKRGSEVFAEGTNLSQGPPLPSVVLLIDPSFSSLPWEGLPLIEKYFGGKTCRDFSIHMHGHRLTALQGGLSPATPPPASKDMGTPNPSLCVGPLGVKILADPFGDDKGSVALGYERDSIRTIVTKVAFSKDNNSGIPGDTSVGVKWTNMSGGDPALASAASGGAAGWAEPPCLAAEDWVLAATPPAKVVLVKGGPEVSPGPGAVLAYTMGRLSALLSPRDVVSLNMEHLALLFVADMSLNDSSYRRQNSSDNVKRPEEIAMEGPWAMAAALSLAGVGSLVIHRWSTSLAAQRKFVLSFWEQFANKRNDVCTSLSIANSNNGGGSSQAAPGLGLVRKKSITECLEEELQQMALSVTSKPVKRWVRLARTSIGLPSVCYNDDTDGKK